ncbi:MAG TPA: serine hydrolase [Rhizobacter sp.]
MPRPARFAGPLLAFVLAAAVAPTHAACTWRAATPEEQALDAEAFAAFDRGIGERLPDVQSLVVVLEGRIAYQYHRDGQPEALRDTQSVTKTALAALAGAALQQGHLASLDTPVLDLMTEWQPLNPDPRSRAITVRHLLALTPGFQVDDATGTAPPLTPEKAWQRPLRADPGQAFAYDNSVPGLTAAVLQKTGGQPLAGYVQAQLVQPLGMATPSYRHGLVQMRTVDMARLGQLFLQDGQWDGRAVLPPGFAAQTLRAHSEGGPPARMPYGLAWWLPSGSTAMANGFGGQWIWVHPPLNVVVAATSTVSPESNQRAQALQLIRGRVFQAVQKRATRGCEPDR